MPSDTRMIARFVLFLLLTLAALPLSAKEEARTPWVVATYAYPQRDRAAAIQPLADYLARRGRHPVQVKLFPSPTALVQAMRDCFGAHTYERLDQPGIGQVAGHVGVHQQAVRGIDGKADQPPLHLAHARIHVRQAFEFLLDQFPLG